MILKLSKTKSLNLPIETPPEVVDPSNYPSFPIALLSQHTHRGIEDVEADKATTNSSAYGKVAIAFCEQLLLCNYLQYD